MPEFIELLRIEHCKTLKNLSVLSRMHFSYERKLFYYKKARLLFYIVHYIRV